MDQVFDLRNLIRMGIVQAVDDSGQAQSALVQTNDGATHAAVEVQQPFGFASLPPADGALAVVLAIGGDPGQLVVLPLGNPSSRFGALLHGEVAIYGSDGTRVHIRQGGTVEVHAAAQVIVNAPTLVVQGLTGGADAQVTVRGDMLVTGDISDRDGLHGTVANLRDDYNAHDHMVPNVQAGSSSAVTTTPTPQDT